MKQLIKKEKVFIETTVRREVEETTYLGLFTWRKIINTTKIKDDIVLWCPYGSNVDLDNIWLYRDGSQKQRLVIDNRN